LYQNYEFIVFRISINSKTYRASDKNGVFLRLGRNKWELRKTSWKENNLTYLVPFSGFIGYGVLTDSHDCFIEYYLNYQRRIRIIDNIIDTLDLECDFVIRDYSKKECYWKDIEEYKYLLSKEFFDKDITSKLTFDKKELLCLFEKYKLYLDIYSSKKVSTPTWDFTTSKKELFLSDIVHH